MADGLADHDGPILPVRAHLVITSDPLSKDFFCAQATALRRFANPPAAFRGTQRAEPHANPIYQHQPSESHLSPVNPGG